MTNTLPQLTNAVEIVGTLKEIDLELKTSQNGKEYVKGKVTIVSKTDNKVHEHEANVFVMKKDKKGNVSKLFKGIQTMMNEYKSIEAHGEENADRIKVTGEIDINEYYGKNDDETLKSFNQVKGVFFNRLDEGSDTPDKAVASVEVIVKSFLAKATDDGEVTHYDVNCFTVGYGEKIVPFRNAIVSLGLADAMQNLYVEGSTGRLTFKLNSYVEIGERQVEEEVPMSHGFGDESVKVEGNKTFTKYVRNYEIVSGDLPFEEPKAFTPEQIQDAERKLALAREELKQNRTATAPAVPNAPTGFGAGVNVAGQMPLDMQKTPVVPATPAPADIVNDDMPDF